MALAFDTKRKRVVAFGGYCPCDQRKAGARRIRPWRSKLDDTWEYDGSSWTRVATDGPSPRHSGSMVSESKRGQIVLYGGGPHTWSWNGPLARNQVMQRNVASA